MGSQLTDTQVQQMIDQNIWQLVKYVGSGLLAVLIAIVTGGWRVAIYLGGIWIKKSNEIIQSIVKLGEAQNQQALTSLSHAKDIEQLKNTTYSHSKELKLLDGRMQHIHDNFIYIKQKQNNENT